MNRHLVLRFALTFSLLGGLLLPAAMGAVPITVSAAGVAPNDLQATVAGFRAALGDPNNGNSPGPLSAGRREINWDGGGATTPSPGGTPFTVFQSRGATMTTPGTGFIQASPADLGTQFGNGTYSTSFAAFSLQRLFVPIGSNVTDITFSIPGSGGAQPAFVSAFGAIFSDVDTNATTMEFFDSSDNPLGTFGVSSLPGIATFAFLGVQFDAGEQVARIRITTGNAALGPDDGGGIDVVAMDDFIYSEPIPEPRTFALVALGLAGLGARRSARRY